MFVTRALITIGYLTAIYAFLPFSSGVMLSLRGAGVIAPLITAAYLAAAIGVVGLMLLYFRIRDSAAYLLMACLGLVVAYFIAGLEVPQERIHFLQYSALVIAVIWTLEAFPRLLNVRYALLFVAVLFTSLAGLVDEAIQGVIPGRVFDWRDVGFNATAAIIGAVFYEIIRLYGSSRRGEDDEEIFE